MEDTQLIQGEFEGGMISNKEIYDLLLSELNELEQIALIGKPIYWNNNLWLYPDGSVKDSTKENIGYAYNCKTLSVGN